MASASDMPDRPFPPGSPGNPSKPVPASTLNVSTMGMHLTEQFEGLRLTAYQDVGGVWTIGCGHTGPEVHEGMTITFSQAETLLKADCEKSAATVRTHVTLPVTQDEFDALADFVFNVGIGNFIKSTLLRHLNSGDLKGAAEQFEAWDHVNGKVIAGLLRRRVAEADLFNL